MRRSINAQLGTIIDCSGLYNPNEHIKLSSFFPISSNLLTHYFLNPLVWCTPFEVAALTNFEETGSVCNKVAMNRRILTEATQVEFLGHFAMNPQTIPKVSMLTNIYIGPVPKNLQINKNLAYEILLLQ